MTHIKYSRFKVPGRSLTCTLNLESEASSIEYALNLFEYGPLCFFVFCFCFFVFFGFLAFWLCW